MRRDVDTGSAEERFDILWCGGRGLREEAIDGSLSCCRKRTYWQAAQVSFGRVVRVKFSRDTTTKVWRCTNQTQSSNSNQERY